VNLNNYGEVFIIEILLCFMQNCSQFTVDRGLVVRNFIGIYIHC